MSKKRTRHSAEQIVKKFRDADAMLSAGKSLVSLNPKSYEVSEP